MTLPLPDEVEVRGAIWTIDERVRLSKRLLSDTSFTFTNRSRDRLRAYATVMLQQAQHLLAICDKLEGMDLDVRPGAPTDNGSKSTGPTFSGAPQKV